MTYYQGKQMSIKKGTFCLTMIVRNESKNMNRMLNSVKKFVDFISIVDTGSTDKTVEVIRKWLKNNNKLGKVHEERWVNFSHNRTQSVKLAEKSFPQTEFFLLLDADMELKQVAQKDVILEKIGNSSKILLTQVMPNKNYYPNVRILRNGVPWACYGATHEYWSNDFLYDKPYKTYNVPKKLMFIKDNDDGGYKTLKFVRDEQMLRQGIDYENQRINFFVNMLLRDPSNEKTKLRLKHHRGLRNRYHFYYANTSKTLAVRENIGFISKVKYLLQAVDHYNMVTEVESYLDQVYVAFKELVDCHFLLANNYAWQIENMIKLRFKRKDWSAASKTQIANLDLFLNQKKFTALKKYTRSNSLLPDSEQELFDKYVEKILYHAAMGETAIERGHRLKPSRHEIVLLACRHLQIFMHNDKVMHWAKVGMELPTGGIGLFITEYPKNVYRFYLCESYFNYLNNWKSYFSREPKIRNNKVYYSKALKKESKQLTDEGLDKKKLVYAKNKYRKFIG